ncbi:US8A [Human alphaherpesvirus 1]|nr:US8A [Human alphaherpesvirus 1]
MDPALRSYHQRLRLYTPVAMGINLAASSQPLDPEGPIAVTPRPPIRPSSGKAPHPEAPRRSPNWATAGEVDVGDELIAISDERGPPRHDRPPLATSTAPSPHPRPPGYTAVVSPMVLQAVDAPSLFVAWLAARWLRGASGLGAVLCGIAWYVTSIARGA